MTIPATSTPAGKAAERKDGRGAPRLSTDFLNRFNEALMLIELAPTDASAVDDLKAWTNLGYREHFLASQLRYAPETIAAYDRLEPGHRTGFEQTCAAMTRLIRTMTALLSEKPHPPELPVIVEVASEALRKLIGRTTHFINVNGTIDLTTVEDRSLQADVDALLAR
jgi:hypothetical protein